MELKNSELYASDTSDFSKLTQIADGNYDFEYLYTYKDENVSDVIAYDKTDSTYILLIVQDCQRMCKTQGKSTFLGSFLFVKIHEFVSNSNTIVTH